MPLSCRFYANEFPKVKDTVVVKVKKINAMGAHVTLKEYNNKGILPAKDMHEPRELRRFHPLRGAFPASYQTVTQIRQQADPRWKERMRRRHPSGQA